MKQQHFLLMIIVILLLPFFVCQAVAAERLIKEQPVSEQPGKPPIVYKSTEKLSPVRKQPQNVNPSGFCCNNGEYSKTDKSHCEKLRGVFFATQREAQLKCTGFCCEDGKVSISNKLTCKQKQGNFFIKETDAETRCAKDRGFCCKDGTNTPSTKNECKKQRGTFYPSERIAVEKCRGYCSTETEVSQVNEPKCKALRGKYFPTKQKADQYFKSQKGTLAKRDSLARSGLHGIKAEKSIKTVTLEQNNTKKLQVVPSGVTALHPIVPSLTSEPHFRNLPPEKSDLYVSQTKWSASPKPDEQIGQSAILNIIVTNKGTTLSSETNIELVPTSAPGGVSASDVADLKMIAQVPPLLPDHSWAFSWPQVSNGKWRKGSYQIDTFIQFDPLGESDESNNTSSINFNCQHHLLVSMAIPQLQAVKKDITPQVPTMSKPDLVATLEPPEPILYQQSTYTFRGHIENIGSLASPPSEVHLLLQGKGQISLSPGQNIPALQPGWGVPVEFQSLINITSHGEKKVVLKVDPYQLIDEANENNNSSEYPVFCEGTMGFYDLGLINAGEPEDYGVKSSGNTNEAIDTFIKVSNYDPDSTSPATTLIVSCDGQLDKTVAIESITTSPTSLNYRNVHFTSIWSTKGVKRCEAQIKAVPGYMDFNENNNRMHFSVLVTDKPGAWPSE